MVRNGSYRWFQRYLCKNYDRTFNDKTGAIFAHSKIALHWWLVSIYAFLRFNSNLRQFQCEFEVTRKTIHWRIERFGSAFDAPSLELVGPVELDEVYVLRREERPRGQLFVALAWPVHTQCGKYAEDKPLVFLLVGERTTATCCQRNPPRNRPFNSCWLATKRSH